MMRLSFLVVSMPIHKNSLKLTQIWWRSTQFRCAALTSTAFFVFFLSLAVASQQHIISFLASEATGKKNEQSLKTPKENKTRWVQEAAQEKHHRWVIRLQNTPCFFPGTEDLLPALETFLVFLKTGGAGGFKMFQPALNRNWTPQFQITLETPSKMFSWLLNKSPSCLL